MAFILIELKGYLLIILRSSSIQGVQLFEGSTFTGSGYYDSIILGSIGLLLVSIIASLGHKFTVRLSVVFPLIFLMKGVSNCSHRILQQRLHRNYNSI